MSMLLPESRQQTYCIPAAWQGQGRELPHQKCRPNRFVASRKNPREHEGSRAHEQRAHETFERDQEIAATASIIAHRRATDGTDITAVTVRRTEPEELP